jgi:DNA-binding HxlR family transcriptional regulator
MAERDQLGLSALQLLAEDWMVSVLRGLADGPIRPAELERSLPDAGHSVVIRRLRRLLDSELVSCERQSGVPPHPGSAAIPRRAYYSLTDAGRMLLEVTVEADRWEQTWCSQLERGAPGGSDAIGLSANQRTRKIMLVLADGPLAARDVHTRLPELRRSTLRRRLHNLVLGGLLERQEPERVQRYALTARARQLAMVATLAGRWEWRWSRPEHAVPGSDLVDLLHMLVPVARVSGPMAGICQLHLEADGVAVPDIYLAARAGGILALPRAPESPAEAVGHATPEAWFDALLAPTRRITVAGDRMLMRAVIGALSAALLPKAPQTPSYIDL